MNQLRGAVSVGLVRAILVASLFFLVTPVTTAVAEGLKIAVVDTQEVLNQSIIGKAAKSNVETELKKGQARLAQLKNDFEKASADLSKQSAVLSGAALEERKEAIEKKRTEYERAALDLREGVMRRNDSELGKAVKEIEAVVAEFAKDEGFSFIFERDRQTVVFAAEGIDITGEVVKVLDRKKVAL
jgi:outer membrane protein